MSVRNPYRPWWLNIWLNTKWDRFLHEVSRSGNSYRSRRVYWAARHATKRLRAERDAARAEVAWLREARDDLLGDTP